MAALITSIYIKPTTVTLNSRYESYLTENKRSLLWTCDDPQQSEDGPKGSPRCVTIQAKKNTLNTSWEPFDLEVSGICPTISSWYVPPESGPPARYVIQGKLGDRGWMFESEEQQVKSPEDFKFAVKKMAFQQNIYELPFRVAGNFIWAAKRTDIPNIPSVEFAAKTRLELCFVFNTQPPSGPWESVDQTGITNPDFGKQYYINLFRLFLPDQWELIDAFKGGKGIQDQLSWYLQRCVDVIWDMALKPPLEYPDRPLVQLNPILGQSFYLSPIQGVSRQLFQPQYGGYFNLRRWMSGFYRYCSTFDLAALVQCACVLIASTGNQSLGQTTWGYLNPGTFYGWPAFPENISPIFASDAGPAKDTSIDRDRAIPMDWHVWIEVRFPNTNKYTVVDVSQAFGEPHNLQFVAGTHDRTEYLNLKMNQNWPDPARLPATTPSRHNSDAIIFRKFKCDPTSLPTLIRQNTLLKRTITGSE
ncbi:hypothetical protein FOTG_08832 [Fusarium oxysporum f. sp. vasinfectum 25433]|uniref:Uncharacterized protein n=1 Tax=Fusarium oxysporum f. sp. vasinfectum 25433 TaxID=1089449 RepID=X0LS78_FUSOX|nr:hypothetical protein FOTG_08832 [Fusarium oxysporum f. sp. vasinfectum 25433]